MATLNQNISFSRAQARFCLRSMGKFDPAEATKEHLSLEREKSLFCSRSKTVPLIFPAKFSKLNCGWMCVSLIAHLEEMEAFSMSRNVSRLEEARIRNRWP